MNIYDYFHSTDVADYCKSLNHQFNTLELACIVDNSKKTIEQKNRAFQELIDNYPDMPFHSSVDFKVRTSVHDYLRALIKYREDTAKKFEDPTNTSNTVYLISSYYIDEMKLTEKFPDKKFVFKTIDELFDFVRPHWDRDKINRICIIRKTKIRTHNSIIIHYDYNRKPVLIFDKHNHLYKNQIKEVFEEGPGDLSDLFIHIPSPFSEGDIVNVLSEPCVLKSIPHCSDKYANLQSGAKYKGFLFSDRPDFAVYYYLDEEYNLRDSYPGSFNVQNPYNNGFGFADYKLEYYKEPLKENEKILQTLSDKIKKHGAKKLQYKLIIQL